MMTKIKNSLQALIVSGLNSVLPAKAMKIVNYFQLNFPDNLRKLRLRQSAIHVQSACI